MTEKEFQASVIEIAHTFGWKIAHFRTAMNKRGAYMTPVAADGKGYPDLHLLHPERGVQMYRELKTDVGRLTSEQREWGAWLTVCGSDWAVWRPKDMTELARVLSFGRATAW